MPEDKQKNITLDTLEGGDVGSPEHVEVLKAIADHTRMRILRLLYHEELNVYELCRVLDMPQPRISRHLGALRQAGLVSLRKEGTKTYYSLHEPEESGFLKSYLEELGQSDHPDLERLEESLHQRKAAVESFAEEKAAEWDNIGKLLHNPYASMLALASMAPRGLTVTDLGTGTGLLLPFLSALADHVYAVDHSAAMLRRARSRCRQTNLRNITFLNRRIEELGQELPACDALLLHFVLHQIASPTALFASLRHFLKPGGRVVIVDRVKHEDEAAKSVLGSLWLGFQQEQLAKWFQEAGLENPFWQMFKGIDPLSETSSPIFVAGAQRR
ncbi:MAG: ArsR/SmtB family transcription factor [Verrucomicrobiota bacterium]